MFESFRTNQTVRSNSQDRAMRTAETVRTSENDKNKLETPLANSRAGQQSMSGPSLADSEAGRETMNAPSLANSRAGRESMGEMANNILEKQNTGDGPIRILFASSAIKSVVSDFSIGVLTELAARAKLSSLTITSTYRSPERQINVMYYNCSLPNGVTKGYATYGKKGDAVIKTFETQKTLGKSEGEIKEAMTRTAVEVGFVSDHSSDDYSKVNTIDISYEGLTDKQYQLLRSEAEKDSAIRFVRGKEEGDNALHVEIVLPETKAIDLPEVIITANRIQKNNVPDSTSVPTAIPNQTSPIK